VRCVFKQIHSEINGVPMGSSYQYLTELLRNELEFDGMLVTDYHVIEDLHEFHYIAATEEDAVYISMNSTTIDMSMAATDPSFADYMMDLVSTGQLPESRVDESCARVLQLKEDLGLFDNPIPDMKDSSVRSRIDSIGSTDDRQLALGACYESITLLQNGGGSSGFALPIVLEKVSTAGILLTGPSCNSLTYQTGGWSIHW